MADKIAGKKFVLDLASTTNLEAYLVAIGVAEGARAKVRDLVVTHELSVKDDVYTLNTTSDLKNRTITFKLGQEFDHTTVDNRQVKAVFTRDGTKLLEKHTGAKTYTILWEFTLDTIKLTMTCDGVVATQLYKA